MKKEYIEPELELIQFSVEDVITLSPEDEYSGGSEYPGGGFN